MRVLAALLLLAAAPLLVWGALAGPAPSVPDATAASTGDERPVGASKPAGLHQATPGRACEPRTLAGPVLRGRSARKDFAARGSRIVARVHVLPKPPERQTGGGFCIPSEGCAGEDDVVDGEETPLLGHVEEVVTELEAVVAPESWTGCPEADVRSSGEYALVVHATAAVHDEVARFIAKVRYAPAVPEPCSVDEVAHMLVTGAGVEVQWSEYVLERVLPDVRQSIEKACDEARSSPAPVLPTPQDDRRFLRVGLRVQLLEAPRSFVRDIGVDVRAIGDGWLASRRSTHTYLDDVQMEVLERCIEKSRCSLRELHCERASPWNGQPVELFAPAEGRATEDTASFPIPLGTFLGLLPLVSADQRYVQLWIRASAARRVRPRQGASSSSSVALRCVPRFCLILPVGGTVLVTVRDPLWGDGSKDTELLVMIQATVE